MDFPEEIKLAPGTSRRIEVRFRPIRLEEYDDSVEITIIGKGVFRVPVFARLSRLQAEVTPIMDFGHKPVNEVSSYTTYVRNTGQVRLRYRFRIAGPFAVTPAEGEVAPGTEQPVRVDFLPRQAGAVRALAVCDIAPVEPELTEKGGPRRMTMRLAGMGKY